MPAPKNNKNAEVFVDWDKIDELLRIGCNQVEIATVLGLDEDTLTNHAKKEKGMLFSEYIQKGSQNFKLGIRRFQLRSAGGTPKTEIDPDTGREKIIGWVTPPSVAMQIWLGKQYLGQSEKIETRNETRTYTGFDLVPDDSNEGKG